jgi:hypothetical protein
MAALAMTDDDNIWISASDGDIPKVQAYLAQDASLATKGDHNGYTCMHAAAGEDRSRVLGVLLVISSCVSFMNKATRIRHLEVCVSSVARRITRV